jgi:hypothetical protein
MMIVFFWVPAPCRPADRYQRFGETYVFIFRAEVAMLRSRGMCVASEEGKADGVGQSSIASPQNAAHFILKYTM